LLQQADETVAEGWRHCVQRQQRLCKGIEGLRVDFEEGDIEEQLRRRNVQRCAI
jgi:hypothetical protein